MQNAWLSVPPEQISAVSVRPFLVADSAFPLTPRCMKCYDDSKDLTPTQFSFNYSLISTRCVVEQGFGRLKGRWKVFQRTRIRDPVFASKIATVCCALHNVCERHNCHFEESWLPDSSHYVHDTPQQLVKSAVIGSASDIRNALAAHIHCTHPRC